MQDCKTKSTCLSYSHQIPVLLGLLPVTKIGKMDGPRPPCLCIHSTIALVIHIIARNDTVLRYSPSGYFHIRRSEGGLVPKFASEIRVGSPNFESKNIGDKYPKFCTLNFRYDPKIGILSQILHLVVTELLKFFLLFDEIGCTLPQILPPNFMYVCM